METKEKEYLENLQTQLIKCSNSLENVSDQITESLKSPEIRKFYNSLLQRNNLLKKQELLKQQYTEYLQSTCHHPIWYLDSQTTEQKPLWKCKCIRCKKIKIASRQDFENEIVIEDNHFNYKHLFQEYKSLINQGMDTEFATKTLQKKYKTK